MTPKSIGLFLLACAISGAALGLHGRYTKKNEFSIIPNIIAVIALFVAKKSKEYE